MYITFILFTDAGHCSEDEDEEDECDEDMAIPWHDNAMFEINRKWFESPCGKKTPPRQAKQHTRKVRAVMSACSLQGFKLSCLFYKVTMRDCWLTEFEKIRKAGTVKSYCHSLRFFYRILDSDKPMEAKAFFPKLSEMVIVIDR